MPLAPYSIRESLQGKLRDYLVASGFVNCTPTETLVIDLTAMLAAYREEDIALFPSVFVLSSTQQLSAIAPGTQKVVVGIRPITELTATAILKDCAPLAVDGWSIFVGKAEDATQFQYGLFRSLAHTFATSAEESMVEGSGLSGILAIRNGGRLVVELRNGKSEVLTVSLTTAPAAESRFASDVDGLVSSMSEDVAEPHQGPFRSYLRRLLSDTLQRCHGTLCAVIRAEEGNVVPVQFAKSVWLEEPLLWAKIHTEAQMQKTADSLARLQAVESLVRGMIQSDGVVVFSTEGTVLGYRAFLSANEEERQQQEVEGGGRRRTFALMKSRLDDELRAAFFRSQDGDTECHRANP